MPKTVDVTIAGVVYAMPNNFQAFMKVVEHPLAGDPVKLLRQMVQKDEMLTGTQILGVITAGVRCAGCQIEDVEEQIFQAGVQSYLPMATTYVIALNTGNPEKPVANKVTKKKP